MGPYRKGCVFLIRSLPCIKGTSVQPAAAPGGDGDAPHPGLILPGMTDVPEPAKFGKQFS